MKQSKTPLWKKSCLQALRYYDVIDYLDEISENGDAYGYDNGEEVYYQEYKDQFDELAAGAWELAEAIREVNSLYDYDAVGSVWDDVLVAILGNVKTVLVEGACFSGVRKGSVQSVRRGDQSRIGCGRRRVDKEI